ncbi:MAG: hypothetical protein NT040_12490 [Bacteroidetes bacterium]|nr:hypothetical protein [Bacteroidota bacterium]
MSNLEKYIKVHRDEFDSDEPEPGHLNRFEGLLAAQPGLKTPGHHRAPMLKIAALIVILITGSVVVFEFATREIRDRYATYKQGTELPAEIREAVQYYENQTNTQIATIHKLASNHKDAGSVSASALNEIQSLDAATDELKKSLAENPGNEQILDAIVRNQQVKETMLNTIIMQLSQFNK